jgi:hypothetical protein
MSDAQGKKELAGLARSIDALFSGSGSKDQGESVITEVREPSPSKVEQLPDEEGEQPELAVADPPPGDEPDHGPGRAEPLEIVERPASSGTGDPLEIVEVPASSGTADPFEQEAPASTQSDAPEAPEPAADETWADFEPTALDAAVDAYLAGDVGRASDIERLATEMLDRKEVEPIARSVGRLALAAGDPPEPAMLAVAERIASPIVLGRLARRMGEERSEERRARHRGACRALGAPMARAIRDDLAESTDRLARRIHCDTLVEMGEPGRRIIEEMVQDENRFLVRNAVAILGDAGGEGAAELVMSALANTDARVRREALRSLAKLGDEEAGPLVVGMLDDSDESVRAAAAVAAGELGVERALRPLIAMLDACSDPDECVPLLRSLGQLADPGAVVSIEKHAVRTLFSRPRTDVRIAAYRALDQIGTPHARRLLDQAASDKDPEVKAAVDELAQMR